MITGKDLIAWGFTPGPWFKDAIGHANALQRQGWSDGYIRTELKNFVPPEVEYLHRHKDPTPYYINIETHGLLEGEKQNVNAVIDHMNELMRVPTIKAGAIMPDACPAGSAKGTIPVGGIVATENAIHPGYHSADICCSMAMTAFRNVDPKSVLDAAMEVTHFGPGGRTNQLPRHPVLGKLSDGFLNNPFLNTSQMIAAANFHFGTQGDGNHFFYVGTLKSTGDTVIVTHHGSRKPGALLYKEGMRVAKRETAKIAKVPDHQAWIVADSQEGQDYWKALQTIREWTKLNHFLIHDTVLDRIGQPHMVDRFWNEHNFVFQKPDGLFYHAKGATPAYPNFSPDAMGPGARTLIPMNMAEPILITRGLNAINGLGFSPHGAGRNYSRTAFKRSVDAAENEYIRAQMRGLPSSLDVRWFSGTPDVSEMPGGYKSADTVRRQIGEYGLAEIVDEVLPYGCIMAGEFDWREAGKRLGDMA